MRAAVPMILFCILLTACGNGSYTRGRYRNELDRVVLKPGQSKVYAFESERPMKIGIMLEQDVTGGLVELQQIGSVCKGGTGHWYISRQWQPIGGKIELKLLNNAQTEVGIVVFKGSEPEK